MDVGTSGAGADATVGKTAGISAQRNGADTQLQVVMVFFFFTTRHKRHLKGNRRKKKMSVSLTSVHDEAVKIVLLNLDP